MSDADDGGPAFPNWEANHYTDARPHGGMTLRDYFAAMAMQALVSQRCYPTDDRVGRDAYHVADAMLKERNK